MTETTAAIITIGDELLIGQTVDTNSAHIAQELNKVGIWVKRRIAIGDVKSEILDALKTQAADNRIIIITGGLGPTADDITKPALAEYFHSSMRRDDSVLQHVTQIFERFNRPLTDRNRAQADVPEVCTVLHNARGTAPGMWFELEGVVYVALPGVPHEMQGLLKDEVVPRLLQSFTLPKVLHRTAVTFGQGESYVADQLKDFEAALPANIKLAYLPHFRLLKLRLTARGNDENLESILDEKFRILTEEMAPWLAAQEDQPLAEVIGKLLDERGAFVATAESCTGGYIAHLLTRRAGSSSSYKGGVVSYSNEIKESHLGVAHETLVKHGAVSEESIREMVTGVRERMNVDYAVATSGILGPGGGTPEKPVGTVWIAVASKGEVRVEKGFAHLDRARNIELVANMALDMLRRLIVGSV